MIKEFKELWRYRELLYTLIERDLRIRYKNSFFGFLWSLLNPLITVMVMTVVFKFVLGNETPNFSAYILAAYLPYMFLQMSLLDSAQSILVALPIVKKVYFPREVLPLASILSNFIHFLLALAIFFFYLLAIYIADPRVSPFGWQLVLIPIPLIISFALAVGLGLTISAYNTFFEDIKYIVSVGLYLLFFLCPIMYFSEQVRYSKALTESNAQSVYFLYHLNPIAMLSNIWRKVLVAPQDVRVNGQVVPALPLDWTLVSICALVSFLVLWNGYRVFNKLKWQFVERP